MKPKSKPYSALKKYTFKKGNHDQSQLVIPRIHIVKGVIGENFDGSAMWAFEFDPSCWFDWKLPTGQFDSDVYDWNYKLGGWAPTLEKGNRNGVMFAGRPNPKVKNELEFCFYQNIDGKNYPYEDRIIRLKIDPNDKWRLYVKIQREAPKRLEMEVWTERISDSAQLMDPISHAFFMTKDFASYREIFLWFGGENNSDGEFGGVPDKDITIFADRC